MDKHSDIARIADNDHWLRSFIRRWTKNDDDAEDVLQDAYLQLLRAVDLADRPVESVTAWLYRTARNLLVNRGKKRCEERLPDGLGAMIQLLADDDRSPDTEMLRSMVWDELELALAELPDEQCAAFVLTQIDGLPVKEAARQTGVPVNTLLSRKHYAVMHLRQRLAAIYQDLIQE